MFYDDFPQAVQGASVSDRGSITRWFGSLQAGDRAAAQQLWERFASRLIGLARARLRSAPRRAADEEDAVLSAFDSFCRGAEQGCYPQLNDRGDLWNLLVAITVRKVSDQIQHEQRQKRGGGAVVCEADLATGSNSGQALDDLIAMEPTPLLAAEMTEQCQRLLDLLDDADLRSIALLKMEGYTNDEIASRLDCVRSTVQRKLNLIRSRWEQEVA
jgi:DNA-directed RNA polymerase specialized sigma24 family protein